MKRPVLATLTVLAAAAIAACSTPADDSTSSAAGEPSASAAGDLTPLTVGLTYIPDIQFAPFYVALASGYFADEGLDVTLRHHGSSESLFGALESGDEDVVNAGADEMLQAFSQGTPVVTTGVMYHDYPVELITPTGASTDLAGATIGVPGPYGETYFGLLALLDAQGLTTADVTVANIGYTQQAALQSGQVDAVMGFKNNDLVAFDAAGIDVTGTPLEDPPLVSISVGALQDTAASRAADLAALNRALERAIADIVADPAAAVDLSFASVDELAAAGNQDVALATLSATVPLYGDGTLTPDVTLWPAMYDFMVGAGLASAGADASAAVVNPDAP